MRPFIAATSLPYLAIFAWVEWTVGRTGVLRPSEHATLGLMLGILPPVVVGFTARAVQIWTPRKCLRPAGRRWRAATILGFLNGATSAFLVTLSAHYLKNIHEAVLIAAAQFVTTVTFVYFMPAAKPGCCPACDYDLRGSLDSLRCPECGRPLTGLAHS